MNKKDSKDCGDVIRTRRSIRKFKDIPLEKEKIDEILNLAQTAPSAGNLQSRDFIIVRDWTKKHKLAIAALDQTFIEQAPVVIVAVANIERSSRRYGSRGELYGIQDASASVMTILLAAHSMGISSCWVGAFDDIAVSELLALPCGTRPVAIVPLGIADEAPISPSRMDTLKNIHLETW